MSGSVPSGGRILLCMYRDPGSVARQRGSEVVMVCSLGCTASGFEKTRCICQ